MLKGKKRRKIRRYVLGKQHDNTWVFLQKANDKTVITTDVLYNHFLKETFFGSNISLYERILIFQEYIERSTSARSNNYVAVINGNTIKRIYPPNSIIDYKPDSPFDLIVYATGTLFKNK